MHRRVELTSLFDDLARAGQEPTTQLLDYRVGPPDEEVARELSLKDDREVVSIHRLRCANGEPLAVMINHLPADLAPDSENSRATASTKPCAHVACTSGWRGNVSGPGEQRERRRSCSTRSPVRHC